MIGTDMGRSLRRRGQRLHHGQRGHRGDLGNEGDDWIETAPSTARRGDNFDEIAARTDPGNDVFIGDGGFDEFIGEGGDDILIGSPGSESAAGMSGFDWATFKDEQFGVNVDMSFRAFDEDAGAALQRRRARALRADGGPGGIGAQRRDARRRRRCGGDRRRPAARAACSPTSRSSPGCRPSSTPLAGTPGIAIRPDATTPVTSFGSGNIMLGGDGGDIIEGRGGDDLIDGDAWLDVNIGVHDPVTRELFALAHDMRDLQGLRRHHQSRPALDRARDPVRRDPGETSTPRPSPVRSRTTPSTW